MVEIEVPLEGLQEEIHHAAHGGHEGHGGDQSFNLKGALLSALLAVLAAVSALLAGHHANEAVIEQIESSDQWSFYQAKSIKASITEMRLTQSDGESATALKEKLEEYKKEQAEIKEKAEEKHHSSSAHLKTHETLASSVTFFQVAIAMTAISVLTRRRKFMGVALVLGIAGAILFAKGLIFH